MAITLKVTGGGAFAGAETKLAGYSASEDATPIEPSDSRGGAGAATYQLVEDASSEGSILLRGSTVELTDGANGRTIGTVTGAAGNNGALTVTAASRLNQLVIDCIMPPYNGTLDGAFRYYLAVAKLTTNISVDPSIASRAVTLPTWTGDLWDHIKKLCVAQQVEVSLVSDNIVLRPLRTRIAETAKNSDESWAVADGDLAQFVEIMFYNNTYKAAGLAYPAQWLDDAGSIIQVDTNEISVTTVNIDASLQAIIQPTVVGAVDRYYNGNTSVYCVIDSKGDIVDPGDWSRAGGFISVALGVDLKSLIITTVGASLTENSPYRIAAPNGPDNYYASLRIVGAGVFAYPDMLTLPTGASPAMTPQIIGTRVDSPFISTMSEAYSLGMLVAGRYAGATQTVSATATVVNRAGANGQAKYPTFADFDLLWAGKTFTQFNTAQGSNTYTQFNGAMFATVADTFENQAFGNVAGARVRFRSAMYRIRSASITHDTISYSGERDTLFSDFTAAWQGQTFAQFNARMAGKTFANFGVIPLWR